MFVKRITKALATLFAMASVTLKLCGTDWLESFIKHSSYRCDENLQTALAQAIILINNDWVKIVATSIIAIIAAFSSLKKNPTREAQELYISLCFMLLAVLLVLCQTLMRQTVKSCLGV